MGVVVYNLTLPELGRSAAGVKLHILLWDSVQYSSFFMQYRNLDAGEPVSLY